MPTGSMSDVVSETIKSFRQYTPDHVASGLVDMRSAASVDIVAVVVCRAVNIGMLMARAHIDLKEMDAALA